MSWQEQLRPGSFRGAAFFVDTSDVELGRRTIMREFPYRNSPFVEDLGKRAPRFSIELLVIGPNYMVARDKLRKALETPGAGNLVHPFLGEVLVALEGPVRLRESTSKGGVARFSCSFIEVGKEQQPSVKVDTGTRLKAAANLSDAVAPPASSGSAADLTGVYDDSLLAPTPSGLAPAVVADLANRLTTKDELAEVLGTVKTTISKAADWLIAQRTYVDGTLQVLDDLEQSVNDVVENLDALIAAPEKLANELMGLLQMAFAAVTVAAKREAKKKAAAASKADANGSGSSTFGSSSAALGSSSSTSPAATSSSPATAASQQDGNVVSAAVTLLNGIGDFAPTTVIPASLPPSAVVEQTNDAIVVQTIVLGALSACCDALPDLTFESLDQAEGVRDAIVAIIERQQDGVVDDDLFQALLELKAAAVAHLEQVAGTLPTLASFTPAMTLPALAVAYELYEDATRDEEIARRNDADHPSFLPGGVALEVLSDA